MVHSHYLFINPNYGIKFYQRLKKNISNLFIFKALVKEKLLSTGSELDYFWIQEINKRQLKDNVYIYFAFKGAW